MVRIGGSARESGTRHRIASHRLAPISGLYTAQEALAAPSEKRILRMRHRGGGYPVVEGADVDGLIITRDYERQDGRRVLEWWGDVCRAHEKTTRRAAV